MNAPVMNAPILLATTADALAAAAEVAAAVRAGASERDAQRTPCDQEITGFSESGLWAITVPARHGGPDLGYATLAQVTRLIAAADPSVAQIPRSHFHIVDLLSLAGDDAQQNFFFSEILGGKRFSQAASERGGKTAMDISTRLETRGGRRVLNGRKFYATGCVFADWIGIVARDDHDDHVQAFIPRHSAGLTIEDDWTGFGQRGTASGTVLLEDVEVDPGHVMPFADVFIEPTMVGAASQIFHAAIDAGIGAEAMADAVNYVRTRSRPWIDSGLDRAADDPYVLRTIGDMQVRLAAAIQAVDAAARLMDAHRHDLDDDLVAEISVAVAIAKVLSTESALFATNKLFEVSGTGAVLEKLNLNRHWRNARTHTLHDPVAWKYHVIGNYVLNQTAPRKHNYL